MSESITNLADAVAALGALPMPAGNVPQRVGADPRVELIRKERTHCEIAPFESEDERPLHVWGPSQYPTREMCQRCTVMRDWAEDPEATDVVLLAEIDRLLAERHSTNESLSLAAETLRENRDRIAELEAQRERRRLRLIELQNDALNMRGALSPNGEARKVPFPLGETLAPAVDWLIARVAELEALTPAAIQTCRVCGAGYSYGEPCQSCEFKARMAAELQARGLEDPHDSPLHHAYKTPRDLPELGGQR